MDWRGSGALAAISTGESSVDPADGIGACSLYYMHARLAGPLAAWTPHLQRAKGLGSTHVCLSPLFATGPNGDVFLTGDFECTADYLDTSRTPAQTVTAIAELCQPLGLGVLLDVALDRVAADSAAAHSLSLPSANPADIVDPRRAPAEQHAALLPWHDDAASAQLIDRWSERLLGLHRAGASGFRLLGLDRMPPARVGALIGQMRRQGARCVFLGWTPGLDWPALAALVGSGLNGVFASTAWWDGRASWYMQEHALLSRIGPVIAMPEAPFGERRVRSGAAAARQSLSMARATGDGLLVPMGFELGARQQMDPRFSRPEELDDVLDGAEKVLSRRIAEANDAVRQRRGTDVGTSLESLTGPASAVTVLRRGESLVLINSDLSTSHEAPAALEGVQDRSERRPLEPGEVREIRLPSTPMIVQSALQRGQALKSALRAPRIVIDRLSPSVDRGAFPAKRIAGRPVTVEADVFVDGHDVLGVELLWKASDQKEWQRAPMSHLGNDRWQASFTPLRFGRWQFTVEAWLDDLATVRHALEVKRSAGVDFSVETAEEQQILAHRKESREQDQGKAEPVRPFQTRAEPLTLEVERPSAEFSSWYELFPRSATGDPGKHGTFADVIERLPRIRDMGFDVLYFPPIHPIGKKNRKGRNNSLTAAPGDHGSPYAIGGAEGGHTALHPDLGTFDDFRRLIDAARRHGLEIALDFAIQCSPDHPWLKQHPEWFRHRPDGTIKYAENPPKKYEDIVNVDFYAAGAMPSLWEELRDSVLFWIDKGVKIFRVDNPHTKPLPFWQWLIADVRGRHPDVIFLAEAFTRPKMMYRLAKAGYSQSYTYFTWRNHKPEITDYLTELTRTEAVEFFRPHFFVNTPDINPYFLQTSGRAGFLIRAALATTLSGLWGMYSGFEICEAAPLPGREEYLDSEKYEIRVRDFGAPGNIVAEITQLNRLRKAHPALQSHRGVAFYNADNAQVLAYGKAQASLEDMVFALVSLDPHHVQETAFEIPLWEWKLPDDGTLEAEDLMTGRRFSLTGKRQWIRLDPGQLPFALWRLWPAGGRR